MPKLPVASSKQIVRVLQKAGFEYAPKRGKGSHSAFVKRDKDNTRLVIVPDRKEIPKPRKCNNIFLQTQSLAKYCVKAGCPNTHILKTVCSVLSNQLFLVFGSNLAFAPNNKNQMHFSGYSFALFKALISDE